jgi:lysophospholipase L1-like esterase
MGGPPVVIVTSGGLPVTNVASGIAFTPVDSGLAVTLVDSGGLPITLINADGTLWSSGVSGAGGDGSPIGLLLMLTKAEAVAATSDTPTSWSDTGENTVTANYIRTSVFAWVGYTTTATEITLNSYNDIYSSFPDQTELGLYVDGVYQAVQPGVLGAHADTITLAAGSKTIVIVNGTQTKPGSTILGTFLVSIDANAALSRITPAPTSHLLGYGDSIIVGGDATPDPTLEAHFMLIRQLASYSVGVEGYGYRSLHDDCADGTARAAFVSKIAARNPSILWIEVGHNDYFLDRWTPADYGTAYAALLDDLHTALPSLTIYAQSPVFRAAEPTNGLGYVLADYRAQVATAATGRGWVTYIDGVQIVGQYSLGDGVHETVDGNYGHSEFIRYTLGITTPPTPTAITSNAGTDIVVTDNATLGLKIITKAAGTNGFNADAVSAAGFSGDFTLKFYPGQHNKDVLCGVSANPTADSSYNSIDYAVYFEPAGATIYESGTPHDTDILYDYQRPFWIARRGTTLTYRQGFDFDAATVIRTVTSVSATLKFDSSLFQVGAVAKVSLS